MTTTTQETPAPTRVELAGSLPETAVLNILRAALAEDAPYGDITSQVLIPAQARATAVLAARVPGVFSGGAVFAAAMRLTDPAAVVDVLVPDGQPFAAGTPLARVTGNARAVLLAERVALNLVQRMSAIATRTAEFVDLVQGTKARITDTRKTTPGLRVLERYAVRCGGGANHRFSLSDAVLAKDNHLAVITGGDPAKLTAILRQAKAQLGHTTHFEVEVDSMDQIEPVLAAGVDTIMLDNFTANQLLAGVALVNGRARVEASGNVNLHTVAGIAATGVDVISIGGLTHSVVALDLGLDMELTVG
jgi:nicotinate-nucleotide pyrophosphorylase (carboxylating)